MKKDKYYGWKVVAKVLIDGKRPSKFLCSRKNGFIIVASIATLKEYASSSWGLPLDKLCLSWGVKYATAKRAIRRYAKNHPA